MSSDRQGLQGLYVAARRKTVDVVLPSIVLRIYMLRGDELVKQNEMSHVDELKSNTYSSLNSTTKQSKVQQEWSCYVMVGDQAHCTVQISLPRTLACSWFLKGPKYVSTDDRAEIATTRHTGGPEHASAPSVSASSAEHCSNVI